MQMDLQKKMSFTDAFGFQKSKTDAFYIFLFVIACIPCFLLGAFSDYKSYLSLLFLACATASFFSDYFYVYVALFMFVRHSMILSIYPAFELYSCLMAVKILLDVRKIKVRTVYLPALAVLVLHTVFVAAAAEFLTAMKILLFLLVAYFTLCRILADDQLMRKFLLAFLIGALVSGVYGYTAGDTIVDMTVAGGGAKEIVRNYGILYDPNFASMFYVAAFYIALFIKGLPKAVKVVLAAIFFWLLLETTSLAGMITFVCTGVVALFLRYRLKAVFILLAAALAAAFVISLPQVRRIEAVANLLLRVQERLHYISIGRWDMFTTGRTGIWEMALKLFNQKSVLGKLFGGSLLTMNLYTTKLGASYLFCHQSVIQGLLNFGIIGTTILYLSFGCVFLFRTLRQLLRPAGYANEDIRILQLILSFNFFVVSMTIDTFVDWTCMLFFFI